MAGANDGARLGAVVDRGLVAERIAARTAPLPSFARPAAPTVPAPGAAFLVEAVDVTRVEAVRTRAGLPLLPFVARAAVDAARATAPVHLGTGAGVVRDAGALRLRALAAALDAARGGDGATLTLLEGPAALAALPGAGPTLTVGRVDVRAVARPGPGGEWALAVRPMANLTLSFDPAALPDAAGFLARVRDHLEARDWEVEL